VQYRNLGNYTFSITVKISGNKTQVETMKFDVGYNFAPSAFFVGCALPCRTVTARLKVGHKYFSTFWAREQRNAYNG